MGTSLAVLTSLLLLWGTGRAQPTNNTYSVGPMAYTYYNYYSTTPTTMTAVYQGCTTGAPAVAVEELTIADVHDQLLNGTFTCAELVQAYLQRISAYDKVTGLNSIYHIFPDAVEQAGEMDMQLAEMKASGTSLPSLFCIPFIIKENYDVVGKVTTNGATAFLDNFPSQDATMISKIVNAGALLLASGGMSEWAFMQISSIGSAFGVVRNPYGLDQSTGGSSGGPAAATAANFGMICFGSDTGSSIRTPAAFQSLSGLRVTTGLISRAGIVPLDLFHDTGGPLARTVTDLAKVIDLLPGVDPLDPMTSLITEMNVTIPDTYVPTDPNYLQGKRIGVWYDLALRPNATQDVLDLFSQAIADMEALGAILMNVSQTTNSIGELPFDPNDYMDEWYVGYGADGHWEPNSGNCPTFKEGLEQYMETAGTHYKTLAQIYYAGEYHPLSLEGIQADVTNFNSSNTYPDPALYTYPGQNLTCTCTDWTTNPCQGAIAEAFLTMLDDAEVDAVIYPVHDSSAPYIGQWTYGQPFVINTDPAPASGTPALSTPMGYTSDGIPSGLMIHGRHWDEANLLAIAFAYEQATQHRQPSPLFPECTDAAPEVPFSEVLRASSDSVNYAYGPATPITAEAPVAASAGRRLKSAPTLDTTQQQAMQDSTSRRPHPHQHKVTLEVAEQAAQLANPSESQVRAAAASLRAAHAGHTEEAQALAQEAGPVGQALDQHKTAPRKMPTNHHPAVEAGL